MSVTHAVGTLSGLGTDGIDDRSTAPFLPNGTPNPEYAAALGLLSAPLTQRAIAFGIDLAFIFVLTIPVVIALVSLAGYLTRPSGADAGQPAFLINVILLGAGLCVLGAATVLQLVVHGRMGMTFGKAFVGIRSVNAVRFDRPGFWRIGGNWLIDVRNGLNPYDARAFRHALRHLDGPHRDAVADAGLPPLAGGVVRAVDADRSPLFASGFRLRTTIDDERRSARPAADTQSGAVILFDSGVQYKVRNAGLIGRSPHVTDGESGMELLSLVDDSLSVSKTHAEFGIDEHGFWIGDRASRNGTAIRSAAGASAAVKPGTHSYLRSGDTVFIGNRSFVVRQA